MWQVLSPHHHRSFCHNEELLTDCCGESYSVTSYGSGWKKNAGNRGLECVIQNNVISFPTPSQIVLPSLGSPDTDPPTMKTLSLAAVLALVAVLVIQVSATGYHRHHPRRSYRRVSYRSYHRPRARVYYKKPKVTVIYKPIPGQLVSYLIQELPQTKTQSLLQGV